MHLFPVFIHKKSKISVCNTCYCLVQVPYWTSFATKYMHYDCLGKKIGGYDDISYRFTDTFFLSLMPTTFLNRGRRSRQYVAAVAYRGGGVGGFKPHLNSEVLTKSNRIANLAENV